METQLEPKESSVIRTLRSHCAKSPTGNFCHYSAVCVCPCGCVRAHTHTYKHEQGGRAALPLKSQSDRLSCDRLCVFMSEVFRFQPDLTVGMRPVMP